jgi:hypothetical protein
MTTATQRTSKVFGGSYTAAHNADGTWDLYEVPVLSVLPKGAKVTVSFDVGRAWLDRTLRRHQTMFEKGQRMHPLHLLHHKPGAQCRFAGFFLPKRVSAFDCNGRSVDTLFADFVRIPADVFAEIEAGKWPYVSAEVDDWNDNLLMSVSLLNTTPNFFEYPLLTVGDKLEQVPQESRGDLIATRFDAEGDGPALGMLSLRRHARTLFAYGGKEDDKKAGPGKPEGNAIGSDGQKEEVDGVKEEKTTPEQKPNGGDASKGAGDSGAQPVTLEAVFDCVKGLSQQLGTLFQSLGIAPAGAAPTPLDKGATPMSEEKPKVQPGGDAPVQPAAAAAKPAEAKKPDGTQLDAVKPDAGAPAKLSPDAEKATQLSARVEALEAAKAARDAEDHRTAVVDQAMDDLKGWPQKPTLRATLLEAAKMGDDNLTLFVKSYQDSVPKDPAPTLAQLEHQMGRSLEVNIPEEAKSYFQKGAEHAEAARQMCAEYPDMKRSGFSVPLVSWLKQGIEERVAKIKGAGK